MNLKRCNNGHFYDADQYTSCPHCNPTVSSAEVTVAMDQTEMLEEAMTMATEFTADDNKTVSLQDAVSAAITEPQAGGQATVFEDDSKTVSYFAEKIGSEPVVGWLVCTEGEYFGESFKLKSGRNFIGRSASMDVSLGGDNSVSRERHAIVVYEPRARIFIAQPGDSRELFYLNDEVVLNNEKMKNYDVLSIGKSKLMLIACCGEQFCWEDLTDEKKDKE